MNGPTVAEATLSLQLLGLRRVRCSGRAATVTARAVTSRGEAVSADGETPIEAIKKLAIKQYTGDFQ